MVTIFPLLSLFGFLVSWRCFCLTEIYVFAEMVFGMSGDGKMLGLRVNPQHKRSKR